MMRNPEQTIGNLIDKQSVSFIGSIADDGVSKRESYGSSAQARRHTILLVQHKHVINAG